MKAEQNELITRIGPGTPCGAVMRHYWQPVALVDEFNPALDPRMAIRPVKAVRILGQDLVLFRNALGDYGLLDRDCPHRGADLAFGRNEGDGLRCPFHGWKFDVTGQCIETPAEPTGSTLCTHVGLSGPAVLDVSRHWLVTRHADPAATLSINGLPEESAESIDHLLVDGQRRLHSSQASGGGVKSLVNCH
jgi:nitrite reductase/ring-hydroxylating ferredoxin subunit